MHSMIFHTFIFLYMTYGIKTHGQQACAIYRECKPVWQTILHMKTVPDIIQHIKVHAQCQQSQSARSFATRSDKTQLLIQQIKYYQNQHNHTTININPRLVIIDINRFHQCKMSSHLGNSICVKLNLTPGNCCQLIRVIPRFR